MNKTKSLLVSRSITEQTALQVYTRQWSELSYAKLQRLTYLLPVVQRCPSKRGQSTACWLECNFVTPRELMAHWTIFWMIFYNCNSWLVPDPCQKCPNTLYCLTSFYCSPCLAGERRGLLTVSAVLQSMIKLHSDWSSDNPKL